MEVRGHTDLTLDGLKFSGNAQRRKRRSLLFHGSFLLQFDLSLISHTLRLPAQQPEYRANRPHESFLTNLALARKSIESALIGAWSAHRMSSVETQDAITRTTAELLSSKYSRREWNLRE
jgi:lipoate-protein ligase A